MLLASIAAEAARGSAKPQKVRQSARGGRSPAPAARPSGRISRIAEITAAAPIGASQPPNARVMPVVLATATSISTGRAAGIRPYWMATRAVIGRTARTAASSRVVATTSGNAANANRSSGIPAAPPPSKSTGASALADAMPATATTVVSSRAGMNATSSSRAASPPAPARRRGRAQISAVSAPTQQKTPMMETTPIAANSAPDPVVPKPRTITTVSTNPSAPFSAAPASPTAPFRALRRTSPSAVTGWTGADAVTVGPVPDGPAGPVAGWLTVAPESAP